MNKFDYKNLTPFKWFVLENFPFIEADFDALTEWQLFCKLGKEINKIIDSQNIVGTQMENVTNAFIELQNYVNNYFENLDVQDEINNKLNDMVEKGELQELISDYLNSKAIFGFDNINKMKISDNLIDGSYAHTMGYYSPNDGGGALYKIRTITNDDVVDNASIIAMNDKTLVAELIYTNYINTKQFGITHDGITDDSDNWQLAINFANEHNIKLKGFREYSLISKTLLIPVPISIEHLYLKATDISNFTNNYMIYLNTTNGTNWINSYNSFTDNKIEDIKLYNTNTSKILNGFKSIANIQINNIYTYGLNKTFDSNTSNYIDAVQIKNIMISHKTGSDYCIDIGFLGDMTSISDGHIYDSVGNNYFIRFNGAHRPSSISNIINGIINLNYGNLSLKNYHGEGEGKSYILLNNGAYSLDTLSITGNKPCIRLNNAKASINNFLSFYNYDKAFTTDNDIELTNDSKVDLLNSYKDIAVNGAATDRLYSKIKTNVADLNYIKNEIISNSTNEHINTRIFNIVSKYTASSIREISSGTWQIESGTYYYKLCPYYDRERGIRSNYVGDINITLGENAHCVQIGGVPRNLPIRVMRGTQSGIFTHYVDLLTVDPLIRDNGDIVNGKKWESFSDPVTAFNGNTGYDYVKYSGNNVITQRYSIPDAGTWTKGDIVYNSKPTSGQPYKWLCTESGTPGTWQSLGDL